MDVPTTTALTPMQLLLIGILSIMLLSWMVVFFWLALRANPGDRTEAKLDVMPKHDQVMPAIQSVQQRSISITRPVPAVSPVPATSFQVLAQTPLRMNQDQAREVVFEHS